MPSERLMVVGKDYNADVKPAPFAVYGNGGSVSRAASRVQPNIGFVPPPYSPPVPYDEYAYPGRKFGVEKLYEQGAVFVGISVILLVVAACFLI